MAEPRKIRDGVWELPKEGGMRVPLRVYANDYVKKHIEPGAYNQGKNMAHLPGIQKYSIMLPDTHFGYGFPIGGVAAFSLDEGVISPGGVGYDINCGVRLLTTTLTYSEVKPKLGELMDKLFRNVPSGVGSKGRLQVTESELDDVLVQGAGWAVEHGYGRKEDLERIEENGSIEGADPSKVSDFAKKRGRPQLGTLGAGNHFLEVQKVADIFDEGTAGKFGITGKDQVCVMLHCGSRGFGYQVCDDYIRILNSALGKYKIDLPDRQLVCAPLGSSDADNYIGAMYSAVNYAFCNRQVMTQWIRETFEHVFGKTADDLGLDLIYDVCHNIAKFEKHDGRELCVHRKGATRAFPAGRPEVPSAYRETGQPVLIPGDMGTASYVLVGTEKAMEETFGSTVHGAGRLMSRAQAKRTYNAQEVRRKLESKGEVVRAASPRVLTEEAPGVYKSVDEVVGSVELAGISRKVAKFEPLGVTKG